MSGTHPRPTLRRRVELRVERWGRDIAFWLDDRRIAVGRWVTLRKQSIQDRLVRWAQGRD